MEIKINVPTNWSGITLKEYLAFQKDVSIYGEEESGYMACLLHHFCKVGTNVMTQLETDLYLNIKNDLVSFIGNTELPLQKFVKVNGKEYGFEPNLSKIAYGAYLDITKYDTLTIDENWAKIMSILYRPVNRKLGALYTIEPYKGVVDDELFLDVPMDVHFGALHFFLSLLEGLPPVIQNSLKMEKEQVLKPN